MSSVVSGIGKSVLASSVKSGWINSTLSLVNTNISATSVSKCARCKKSCREEDEEVGRKIDEEDRHGGCGIE